MIIIRLILIFWSSCIIALGVWLISIICEELLPANSAIETIGVCGLIGVAALIDLSLAFGPYPDLWEDE